MLDYIYSGAAHGIHNGKGIAMDIPIMLHDGMNNISIASVMVGLPVNIIISENCFPSSAVILFP